MEGVNKTSSSGDSFSIPQSNFDIAAAYFNIYIKKSVILVDTSILKNYYFKN